MSNQAERFQQVREFIISKKQRIFAQGITTDIDENKNIVANWLPEVQETFKRQGFALSVKWRDGKYNISISDQEFMTSEAGVISTEIAVIPHEWSYLVPAMILSFVEKNTDLG